MASETCDHGELARQCERCEAEAEVDSLIARNIVANCTIKRLRAENEAAAKAAFEAHATLHGKYERLRDFLKSLCVCDALPPSASPCRYCRAEVNE